MLSYPIYAKLTIPAMLAHLCSANYQLPAKPVTKASTSLFITSTHKQAFRHSGGIYLFTCHSYSSRESPFCENFSDWETGSCKASMSSYGHTCVLKLCMCVNLIRYKISALWLWLTRRKYVKMSVIGTCEWGRTGVVYFKHYFSFFSRLSTQIQSSCGDFWAAFL